VNEAFYQPLIGLAANSKASRACPEFSDEDYLLCGIQRVLEESFSGRAFLQEHAPALDISVTQSNYFANLHSVRRLELLQEVDAAVHQQAQGKLVDRLAEIPELADYECFAADGHWHKGATHDPRHEGTKMAVGHFYALNLRTHTLRHLVTGEGLHEHDMSALKRIKPKGLRQNVPKGRRVLMVYDKAGIDLDFWKRCRHESAVYFLSRVKENMVLSWERDFDWDRDDPRNAGVTSDTLVRTGGGHLLRLINYTDPISGKRFEFLTNAMDLPVGVLVELYRRRWEIEKVFDELKNKLGQRKAWASGTVARTIQARFLALTHNLLLIYEQKLASHHGVTNDAEDQRRDQRSEQATKHCLRSGYPLTTLASQSRLASQRSVKFVRWLRHALNQSLAEAVAVLRLKTLYAAL
jgi:hypothetical protein